jgi:hypothetical protein
MNIRDMKLPFSLLAQHELIAVMKICKCEVSIIAGSLTICPVCGRHVVNLPQDKQLSDYPNQVDLELIRMFEDLDERIKSKSIVKEEKEKILENMQGSCFDKFPVYAKLKKHIADEIREINEYMNTARSIQSKLVSKCNVFSIEEFKNVYEQYESISIYRLQEIIDMDIDAQHNIKIGDDDDDDGFLY